MKKKKWIYVLLVSFMLGTLVLSACNLPTSSVQAQNGTTVVVADEGINVEKSVSEAESNEESGDKSDLDRPDGWSEESHDKSADPNYDLVFPQDEVNRIDITMDAETWAALQTNMTELFGEKGDGSTIGMQGGGRNGGGRVPPDGAQPDRQAPPDGGDGVRPGLPGGQVPPDGAAPANENQQNRPEGGGMMSSPDPDYVSVTVNFEGEEWTNVGLRYRGNSTLRTSWQSGTDKISFMLDFDEFEDLYPEIDDQRFYGFKKLVFHSNAFDSSYIREKVVADIFRDAGVAAAQTAFYEVYVDYGEGPVYFGLYTALEMVDNTVIKTQFEDDDGNVYKPEGNGASFAEGTFSEASFEKLTNQDEEDWSDIQAVFAALHADTRMTNPEQWRADLEAVFDVDTFLNWLAVDTLIQNWDTYGVMNHNYYLYTDPDTEQIVWIPWDNNMALSEAGGVREPKTLDQESIGDNWPLIRYLLDDPVYYQTYLDHLENTLETVFYPERMSEIYQTYHDLIAPYVEAESPGKTQLSSIQQFNTSVEGLINHVTTRYQDGIEFLNQ